MSSTERGIGAEGTTRIATSINGRLLKVLVVEFILDADWIAAFVRTDLGEA